MNDRIPPFEVFLSFCFFLKLVSFGDGDKDQAGYDFPSHLIFLAFFVFLPAYFYIFGGRGDLERIPSFLSCFHSYITYFST